VGGGRGSIGLRGSIGILPMWVGMRSDGFVVHVDPICEQDREVIKGSRSG